MIARDLIISCLLLFYIIFFGYLLIWPLLKGTPFYYPTGSKTVKRMVGLARIKKSDKVIDLGSGDGRILFEAAKYSDHVVGVEYNPFLVWFTQTKAFIKGTKNIKVKRGDLYKIDLNEFDVVFCYLLPEAMQNLSEKFKKELKPGSRIITNTFQLKEWKPAAQEEKVKVYVK